MNKIELATEQLLAIYRQASQELLLKAVEASARNAKGSAAYYRSLWAQVEDKIRTLDMAVGSYSKQVIPLAYSYGVNEAVKGLLHLGLRAKGYDAFQKLHESSIKILVENLNDNLIEANHLMGRRIKDEWRRAQLEAITRKQATGETWKQTQKSFTEQVAEKGLGSFKDSMGRVWQIDRYAEMVSRSVTREATNSGLMAQLTSLGYDLVQMSSHSSPCPICAPLEGRVYSISGESKDYPKLDKAFGEYANIHPYCKHVLLPYVPELDENVKQTKELSNRPFDIDPRTKNKINVYNAKQTAARWQRATEKQWWQYKQRLGDVPSLKKFAEMKKADSEQYKQLQARYRSAGTYQKQAASAKEV